MGWCTFCIGLVMVLGGMVFFAQIVSGDPNSVFCYSNPCQNNGTCINLLRPGSDNFLSVCTTESCYKLIPKMKSWEEATIACGMMGAALVSVENDQEKQRFERAIKDNRLHRTQSSLSNAGGFWSSGNDLRYEGSWEWGSHGDPVTIWFPSSMNKRTRNCLMLNTDLTRSSRMRWEATECNRRLYFACKMAPETLYQERTFQCLCPEGYFGEFCEQTSDLLVQNSCSDTLLILTCDNGQHLSIVRAKFYLASQGGGICGPVSDVTPTGSCVPSNSLNEYLRKQVLQKKCEGFEHCIVNITNEIEKYDQCASHQKYVEVTYRCRDTYVAHVETCQTFTAYPSCQNTLGLPYIRVDFAVYGRLRRSSTCSESTISPVQVPVNNCRAITTLDIAASRCNGRSVCNITASHDLFGDPCLGIFKYLDITYQCVSNLSDASASYPLTYGIATLAPPVSCPAENHSEVEWRTTTEGHADIQRCPKGQDGLTFRRCTGGNNKGQWLSPDFSQCTSPWIKDISQQIEDGKTMANVLAEVILNRTATSTKLQGGDLQKSVSLMNDLVDLQTKQLRRLSNDEKQSTTQEFGKTLLEFGSNLLGTDKQSTWESVKADDAPTTPSSAASPATVTENLEKTSFLVAEHLTTDKSMVTISTENILMTAQSFASGNMSDSAIFQDTRQMKDGSTVTRHAIQLPPSATKSQDPVQVVFLVYETLGEYLTDIALDDTTQHSRFFNDSDRSNDTTAAPILNSAVVSTSVKKASEAVKTFDNEEEVRLEIRHAQTNITGNVTCVFWNSSKSLGNNGAWSNKGCRLITSNGTYSVCACNHLTNFAILMDVTGTHEQITQVHDKILTAFTFIGCSVSIVCLVMSLVAFTCFRNIWSLRVTIHRNLCLMLLIANVLFIAGVEQTQVKILCSIIAGLLHYCFLSAFVWMSLEAVQFYIMLVHVFSTHSKHWPYYLAGYGLPAVVVGVSAGINSSGYGTDRYCWLSTNDNFIWSFTGPVGAIIAVNLVLLVVSLRIAYSSRSSIAKGVTQTDIRPWIKGATTLLFLLGITWGIGFFFINQQSLAIAYIFTILNSLQGLFIFVFYCFGNERVGAEFKKFLGRQNWLPLFITNRYASASTTNSWVECTPRICAMHDQDEEGTEYNGREMHRGATVSRRQTCTREAYHKTDGFQEATVTSLSNIERIDEAPTQDYQHPTINIQLVRDDEDIKDDDGDVIDNKGATNAGYDVTSRLDNSDEITADESTSVDNVPHTGSSWLHKYAVGTTTNNNQYPRVDYE